MPRVTLPGVVALLSLGTLAWVVPVSSEDGSTKARTGSRPGTIYFLDGNQLARVHPDGRNRISFPRELAALGYFQPYTARVAPDGRRLAFGLGDFRNGAIHPPSTIHVADMTRARGAERLVDLPGTEVQTWAWSPDGRRLAFSSWDASNGTRNWIVDVRTRKVEQIELPRVKTAGRQIQMAINDWSPDGQWFVASGAGVHLVRIDGTKPRRLTAAEFITHGGSCRFSPDGRKILFVGSADSKSEAIHVAEVPGGKPTPVVQFLNFSDLQACWSPDGRKIAYSVVFLDAAGKRGTESNLNVVDADGKNSVTIVSAKHESQTVALVVLGWR